MFWGGRLVIALCFISDPCMSLSPPCFTEEDRFSLEALQTIHKQMDDDKDGGIEVEESDEVGGDPFSLIFSCNSVTKGSNPDLEFSHYSLYYSTPFFSSLVFFFMF